MRINFHGAAHTVTGSQHLLEINGKKLLLDCGLYQGRRAESYERNLNFKFDPRTVDAVILSHAHIDHSGNLPNLVKHGFERPIYATGATKDIASTMLADSGRIQESDAEFVNKKRARHGQPPVEPIYTEQDAERVGKMFASRGYEEAFEPIPGVVARFYEAGHILGSASVSLEIEEKGKKIHLWFSGDIGRYKLPLLRDPILPSHADYMIMESTYGDKSHSDPELAFTEFRDVVKRTVERGGKVIVPAFAVGRTQEIVYNLNEMMYNGDVPRVPVYVDSPLAVKASDIFKNHLECFDDETREFVRESRHPALDFNMLHYSQLLTDPEEAADFVKKTGVDALAIAIGTSHGAYKFTRPPTGDILAIERIKEIHARIPNTHLVMHGSSSVPQDWLAIINEYGGNMGETYGVPVEEIVEGIKHGVRKVNIDTDLRMASTGAVRKFLAENTKEFDPRKFLTAATKAMKDICRARYEAFGTAGNASKIKVLSLDAMTGRYMSGELDPKVN